MPHRRPYRTGAGEVKCAVARSPAIHPPHP
ncbi:protein of unknown function [Cupriavidus neocaledonicus]|uniref:Uncharacterized protein n=1 Tax=Cupriavidus neocaledonicus TaxID=1040979 RepID=A0A375H608_9BURK|nr:protein of unknown function [Cupriavidus neocaledonicus]